jgi:Niemann-Pick C1 protein
MVNLFLFLNIFLFGIFLGVPTNLCCDRKQLSEMQKFKYILDNLIGRCPSCYYNLLRILCEMACSPDQDEFLWPLETINITRPNEVEQVISDDNQGALFEADADYVDPDEVKEETIEKLPSKPIETVNVINKIRYFVSEKQAQDFIDSCW